MVSIIIRTYNEEKYLPDLLVSIRKQIIDGFESEIILVDSGSTDNTVEIAESYGCKIVSIRKEEFSFGRSLNIGCSSSRGCLLVFVSGHCVPVKSDWLKQLLQPLIDNQSCYVYGRQVGNEISKFSERQLFKKYFPSGTESNQQQYFCNNANAAIPRKIWAEFKFDEQLTGLEDMELAKRLVLSGRSIKYVPTAPVYHIHEESWRKVKVRYEREAIALHQIMPEVQVTVSDFFRYFIGGVLFDFSEAVREGVFFRKFVEIILFRYMQYYGTFTGNHVTRKISKQMKEEYFYPR